MTYKQWRKYIANLALAFCKYRYLFKVAKIGQVKFGEFTRKQWRRIKRSQHV